MSDTEQTSEPDPGEPVDPVRLKELLQRAEKFRNEGEEDVLGRLLDGLSSDERTIYQDALSDHLTEYLDVTVDSQLPSRAEPGDETIAISDDSRSAGFSSSPTAKKGGSDAPQVRSNSPGKSPVDDGDMEYGIPDRIGKFLIKQELGRGAFGVVYLGYDQELQRNVAVKVSLVSDPKLQERLRVEASKLAQAESPGIVPVYHIGRTQDGKVYIVQKYIEGATLRSLLRKRTLSPSAAVALMREIAVGLAPAHAIDILHRDLKPDNILIEKTGKAWIADFGLAISEDEQVSHRRELAGTPPYMSPEQVRGRIDFLDPRSDIWSLGVMFYEVLTGKLPFAAKDRKTLTEQICEMDPRPLQQRAPGLLSESMNDVFRRCCAKKPAERYATVSEFATALDELATEGLSETNIGGETTDFVGVSSALRSASGLGSFQRASHGASPAAAQGATPAAKGGSVGTLESSQTTRTVRRSIGDTARDSLNPRNVSLGLAIATLALGAICIVGYQLYAKRSESSDPAAAALDSSSADAGRSISPNSTSTDTASLSASSGDAQSANGTSPDRPANIRSNLGDGSKERPWIVAPGTLGTHATIQQAVIDASAGDFIRVMPGLYREPLFITKPITIQGQPSKAGEYPCVIENDQQSPLTIDSQDGIVKIRSFEISGKGHRLTKEFNPIEVLAGTLDLESCSLETRSQNCIKVRGEAKLILLACTFLDSSDFAVSAKDFSQIRLRGCDFYSFGVEITGGTGTIESCKFLGKTGIYVANNLTPVESRSCLFEKNAERALFATDGGEMHVTSATIRQSSTGIGVTDQPMTKDAPVVGRPGRVRLEQSRLEECEVALQVEGGTIDASNECFIDEAKIAVGVGAGVANLTDISISRTREKAIVIYQGGEVTMKNSNISGSGQAAVKLLNGSLTFSGGVMEDFSQHGIVMGDSAASDLQEINLKLDQATIRTSDRKSAGLTAYCGRVVLTGCLFEGGGYGVYFEGKPLDGLSADESSVRVTANETRFKNQSGFTVVALGRTRIEMDPVTLASANASGGLKASPPAQIVVDQRQE